MLTCTRCHGLGKVERPFPPLMKDCAFCDGVGSFPELDVDALRVSVLVRGKGPVKKSMNSFKVEHRTYYLWRMIQWHSGRDVRMPMTAEIFIEGDPAADAINQLAQSMAKEFYGTDMGAAKVWGRALGYF